MSQIITYTKIRLLLQPCFQFKHQLKMIGETLADSPSVASCGIDVERGRDVVTVALKIIVCTVGRQHIVIIVTKDNERTGCRTGYLKVRAVFALQTFAWMESQQVIVGTAMTEVRVHCYDGIEKNLEVRCHLTLRSRGYDRSKMAAGRKSHYTHLILVYMPRGCIAAHKTHGLFSVTYRHGGIAVRHTVFKNKHCNSLTIEERRPSMPFMVHSQMVITATRTDYYGLPRGQLFLRKIDINTCRVLRVTALHGSPGRPKVQRESVLGTQHDRNGHCLKESDEHERRQTSPPTSGLEIL